MMDAITTALSTFIAIIPTTLAQSLILSFVVLGIMIPFRLLQFPDLTSEGAFPLGGCVSAIVLSAGYSAPLAIVIGALFGVLAGMATAFIHLRFRIHSLLSGILVTTMLYSLNLRILGKSNQSVFGKDSIFDLTLWASATPTFTKIAIAGLLALAVISVLNMFLRTEAGVALRAVGANPDMAEAQGINTWTYIICGVGLAGFFSALSGALMVQSQGFADVNMGLGILINGLAALIIGEAIIGRDAVWRQIVAPFVGAVVFYLLISACLSAGMPPPDLKLATGLFVLIMLASPTLNFRKADKAPREAIRE